MTADVLCIETELLMQATLELQQYAKRLGVVWLAIFTVISGPIAYQTFDPSRQVRTLNPSNCLSALYSPERGPSQHHDMFTSFLTLPRILCQHLSA